MLGGNKEFVGRWMLSRLPEIQKLPRYDEFEAVGVVRGNQLVGGALFCDHKQCEGGGEVSIWAVGQNWLNRGIIRELLGYPFRQLGCHRITAVTMKNNRPSRRLLEGLGFRLEGMAREGFGPGKHAMIYGLLKTDYKWG